ncbi:MAG: hypothetical protein Q7K54_06310 [Candidatus Parcubacteria bacterium]|nr:hypothetical protein [Candidatus Parcubacteria bacterium]
MPLNIKYNIKLEKQRIKKTIDKLSWYEKLGYHPRFPLNINPKVDNIKIIYSAIKNEYIEQNYEKAAAEIKKEFAKIESDFFTKLQAICGVRIKKHFIIILTKYGVGGSYSLPNKIIYNISMRSSSINTLLHEITHLIIEPYIKKYQIQQNEKERIVDLILTSKSVALRNYKVQKRGKERKKSIDPLFKKYFKPPINNKFTLRSLAQGTS